MDLKRSGRPPLNKNGLLPSTIKLSPGLLPDNPAATREIMTENNSRNGTFARARGRYQRYREGGTIKEYPAEHHLDDTGQAFYGAGYYLRQKGVGGVHGETKIP
jgi:hypothetical protein